MKILSPPEARTRVTPRHRVASRRPRPVAVLAAPAPSRHRGPAKPATATPSVVRSVALDLVAAALAAGAVLLGAGRWYALAALPAGWILAVVLRRGYRPWLLRTGEDEARAVLGAAGLVAAASCAVWLFLPVDDELLQDLLFGLVLAAALTVLLRRIARGRRRSARRGAAARKVLLVGSPGACARMWSTMREGGVHGLQVVAACRPDQVGPTLGQLDCDAVVVLPGPDGSAAQLREVAWELRGSGVDLLVAPVPPDVARERLELRTVDGLPLLSVRAPVLSGPARALKELTDRLFAVLGILFLSPLLLGVAVLVRLTSPGPAFFLQRRVGLDGRIFRVVKFRTMVQDAERRKAGTADLNQYADGPLFKIEHDPRVTRLGRFLRRSSLDELPQLFNVAAGQMSLIGPRPLVPEEIEACTPEARRRLLVKPGMTGLWQVSGRSALSCEERLRLDQSYLENWSPALDRGILARTAAAVLRGSGAY